MPLELTDSNFKTKVLRAKGPILVDFWASWCPPCKMVKQTVSELATQLDGFVEVVSVNVDRNPVTASEYDVAGVPTFVVFRGDTILARRVGAQSKQQLLDMLKEAGVY